MTPIQTTADREKSRLQIPMCTPDLTEAEVQAVADVVRTPTLSIGPRIEAFEQAICRYVGAPEAVAINSGTSGLHLAIVSSSVEQGDLVITTPFSFIASANCILYERAVPVFVDVDPLTGNVDATQVEQAASDIARAGPAADAWLPRTLRGCRDARLKAVIPVHVFGQPADMDPIMATASRWGLTVIEDACEAIGARYKDRPAGTIGHAGVFAFYPNKQITTGEGGVAVTSDTPTADLWRSLRNQGRDTTASTFSHPRLGYNYRLDEMSAALGVVQLQRVTEILERRRQVATWYDERLAGLDLIERPTMVETTTRPSWFAYVVQIIPPARREDVMQQLASAGIPSRPYFPPIHLQPFYQSQFGYRPGDFPVAERLGATSLGLPFSGMMTPAQVDRVCEELVCALRPSKSGGTWETPLNRP